MSDAYEQWLKDEIEVCKGQKAMYAHNTFDNEYWRGAQDNLELARRKYLEAMLEVDAMTPDYIKGLQEKALILNKIEELIHPAYHESEIYQLTPIDESEEQS